MIEELANLLPFSTAFLWAGFIVFVRIGAILALAPAFGEQTIPVRVRLGIAIGFTLIVLPAVGSSLPVPPDSILGLGIFGGEVLTGLIFGAVLRLFVIALETAGTIIAQSTSLSQIFGGSAGVDAQPAMGHVLIFAGLALAVLLGLHVRLAAYMIVSYDLVPAGQMISAQTASQIGLGEIGGAFALAFTLAAPFVLAALIYNVALGVINRAMPQLMVTFVGAPALTAGGLLLFLVVSPILLSVWAQSLNSFMANPFGDLP